MKKNSETTAFRLVLDKSLKRRWDRIPEGTRSLVLRSLMEWACGMFDEYQDLAIGAIISKKMTLVNADLEKVSQGGTHSERVE